MAPPSSHETVPGANSSPVIGSARHRIIAAPPIAPPSAPPDESPLLNEDPETPAGVDWSRFGVPAAGIMAVIVVAWGAPSLIDRAPDSAGAVVRREAPATAGPRPIAAPQVSTTAADRGGDQEARLVEPMPPPVSAADFEIPTSSEGPQGEAVTASSTAPRTGQSETAPQPAAASAQPIRIAQSAPAPAIPAPATPAPAIPAPAAPRAAPSALTANQPQGALLPATETPARWISGGLQNSDNGKGRFEGVVGVRIVVRPDGRAGGCRVTESSGNPRLDEVTCRLVGPRLMFSPARDATGRAIESEVGGQYVWGRRTRQRSLFGIKF